MNEYQPYVGLVLKELRESRGMAQGEAAADARMSIKTLRKIEAGEAIQRLGYGKICALFGGLDEIKRRALEKLGEEPQLAVKASTAKEKVPTGKKTIGLPKTNELRSVKSHSRPSVAEHLRQIDEEVRGRFETLDSPTRRDTNDAKPNVFSASKLIASLTTLGIPVETSLCLLDELPGALEQLVSPGEQLSTNHLRSVVARLIGNLPPESVFHNDVLQLREGLSSDDMGTSPLSAEELKAIWVSRYARRYGAGERAIQILERDGTLKDLNYNFLKDELFPHVLTRLLGDSFSLSDNKIISKDIVAKMARGALEEFKRLGLYTLRYKTALLLAEDLALHPPHPWIVTAETRQSTIEYDFGKAHDNIGRLVDAAEGDRASVEYRYNEAIRHIASGILGVYSGYLGNRETSPFSLLYRSLKLEQDNRVLWEQCQLRLIDGDLQALKINRQDLIQQIERLRFPNNVDALALSRRCEQFFDVAKRLRAQRGRMEAVEAALLGGGLATDADLLELARETVITCLGVRKLRTLEDRVQSRTIGLLGTVRTQGSMIQHLSPSVIFLVCRNPDDEGCIDEVLQHAADQLAAHRTSHTVLLLCAHEPGSLIAERVSSLRSALGRDDLIGFVSFENIRRQRAQNATFADIIDELFE